MTFTNRTDRREDECFGGSGPHFKNWANDLRNNVSGALNNYGIADADVLADDFILVVKRGILHNDAAHSNGDELGHWRQRTGAAHLDVDPAKEGCGFLRREFMCRGPARRPQNLAKSLVKIEPIHLVHDAVDIVSKRGAVKLKRAISRDHRFL